MRLDAAHSTTDLVAPCGRVYAPERGHRNDSLARREARELLHFFYTAVRYEPVSGGTDRDVKCANAQLSGTAWDAMG